MKLTKKAVSLLIPLFLLSCGGNQVRLSEFDEVFETEILDNGTKFFTYRLIRKAPMGARDAVTLEPGLNDIEEQSRRTGPGAMRSGGGPGMDLNFDAIEEQLELKLVETGYCRDGYLELDSSSINGQYAIRGECREAANENDRQTFNNTQSL
ncbi:hypothetical protein GCM10011403_29250 [Pseudohongiella nitratireducens]|jgi:hypothetical protein|uniref:Lipoprotein n=1 Tax=Pseudohongiella nitratireducens TaxID=1768907 RepID=A0A916QPG5_9GAMM|nr:hypothetical protein [Pseudohongiella nitratireducens]GFZ83822.1 hypothetical protein GCM10011403_29250 [Pseudohongiella nitratireducens]|tara:strand:+ start:2098 stop:2553 length:456 start_codon:yes stop_codon:yes gene_type:complete